MSYRKFQFWWEIVIHMRFAGSVYKESACNAADQDWTLGQEDPLEKEMATHSNILA